MLARGRAGGRRIVRRFDQRRTDAAGKTVETKRARDSTARFAVDTLTLPFHEYLECLFFVRRSQIILPNVRGVICHDSWGEVGGQRHRNNTRGREHLRCRRSPPAESGAGAGVIGGEIYVLGPIRSSG